MRQKLALLIFLAVVSAFGAACGGDSDPPAGSGGSAEGECDTSVQEEESGLKIREIECGNGDDADAGDILVVHYTGKLEDGTVFDSSVGGDPFPFQLGAGMVIQGWDQGIEGMQEGGKRELTIPPELGYGEAGGPPVIPPNATLIYEVELVDVQDPSDT